MTEQEIFDKSVTGIFAQGGFGVDHGKACSYRTPTGGKCVVGQLLPDDLLDKMAKWDMENPGLLNIMGASLLVLPSKLTNAGIAHPIFLLTHKHYLIALQDLHDSEARRGSMGTFYAGLRDFADEHNLDTTSLNAAWDKWAYGG